MKGAEEFLTRSRKYRTTNTLQVFQKSHKKKTTHLKENNDKRFGGATLKAGTAEWRKMTPNPKARNGGK